MQEPSDNNSLVIEYRALRKLIGIVGVLLPPALALGAIVIFQTQIQSSLSAYYHTGMGDYFVGTMCALGVFFFAYRGYPAHSGDKLSDHVLGNLAGACAIGVALFPTDQTGGMAEVGGTTGKAHVVFALAFFLLLAWFSYFRFTRSNPGRRSRVKMRRDLVYKGAGVIIVTSIALIGVVWAIREFEAVSENTLGTIESLRPVFFLESIAVLAFAVSWAVKGQWLLSDPPGDQLQPGP